MNTCFPFGACCERVTILIILGHSSACLWCPVQGETYDDVLQGTHTVRRDDLGLTTAEAVAARECETYGLSPKVVAAMSTDPVSHEQRLRQTQIEELMTPAPIVPGSRAAAKLMRFRTLQGPTMVDPCGVNEDDYQNKRGFYRDGEVKPNGKQEYKPFLVSPVTGKPTGIVLEDFPMGNLPR